MTGAERAERAQMVAQMVWCGFCWAAPEVDCSVQGLHLVRYAWAFRQGLIGRAELVEVCGSVPTVTAGQVVTGVTPPASGGVAAESSILKQAGLRREQP